MKEVTASILFYELVLYKWRNGSCGEVDEVFAVKMGGVKKKKSSFAVRSWVQILVFTV